MTSMQEAFSKITVTFKEQKGPDAVKFQLNPNPQTTPKYPEKDEGNAYFFVRDGKAHPDKRHRAGKITSPTSRDGGVLTATIGPNITEIPLTVDQSKTVVDGQLRLMEMTVKRERAAQFQYYAGTALSVVMACLLAVGVYQGVRNPTHYNP